MARLTYLQVARIVLSQVHRPLGVREITEYGEIFGLLETGSRTPETAMSSRLSISLRDDPESPFYRVRRGEFGLREWLESDDVQPVPRPRQSRYIRAAVAVLLTSERPLRSTEILERATKDGHLPSTARADTVRARIAESIAAAGNGSPFARVAPDTYVLREWLKRRGFREYQGRSVRSRIAPREIVLVLRQEAFEPRRFQGIRRAGSNYLALLTGEARVEHVRRSQAERTDRYKQLITYVIVRDQKGRILSFRRGAFSNAATFLRGRLCLGFGGHVEAEDRNLFSPDRVGVYAGAWRELREEIGLEQEDTSGLKLLGVLNDDSSTVGVRHFAFVFEVVLRDALEPQEFTPESSVRNLEWITVDEVTHRYHELEYWSQICASGFLNVAPSSSLISAGDLVERPEAFLITGEIGAGKTEFSRALSKELGATVISTRKAVARAIGLSLSDDEADRPTFSERAAELVTRPSGQQRLISEILLEVSSASSPVILDGIRNVKVLEGLRKRIRNALHIHVVSTPDAAWRRYAGRVGRKVDIDEFRRLREGPSEREVILLERRANMLVGNYRSRQSLRQIVKDLKESWG